MKNDKQIEAVAKAIYRDWMDVDDYTIRNLAKAAIEASHAQYVPELVEALQPFANCCEEIGKEESSQEWAKFRLLIGDYRRAHQALANLPEEMK